ncbi:MAG TPA: hypothetical protein V6C81_02835 [Planktothrix sp.]|jgi:hypothetical protein
MAFTQKQLEDAYKQMQQERQDETTFAQHAADQLQKKLLGFSPVVPKVPHSFSSAGGISPQPTEHVLTIALNQYDDWDGCIKKLTAAGVNMQPWVSPRSFYAGPEGTYDVSQDPQFAGRTKQSYRVKIEYYDGGY